MRIWSPAFQQNEQLPTVYSGQGKDISPPLEWTGVPKIAQSFALFCEDPDATEKPGREYPIIHWVAYNIPSAVSSLRENLEKQKYLSSGVAQGINTLGNIGYNGPRPPKGDQPHRYIFKLYALDIEKVAPPGIPHQDVREAMEGHVLSVCEVIATCQHDQVDSKDLNHQH